MSGDNESGNGKIRRIEVENTVLSVFQDSYDRFKTTVVRVEKLESNCLYEGYDKEKAIRVFDECSQRFDIGEVESLDEIEWDDFQFA